MIYRDHAIVGDSRLVTVKPNSDGSVDLVDIIGWTIKDVNPASFEILPEN